MDKTLIWGLVRVIVALIIIVPAAIYATRWYGKKQIGGTQELQVKEALPLGTNRALYIVEWEEKRLLLGVTNQSITLLEISNINHSSKEDTE